MIMAQDRHGFGYERLVVGIAGASTALLTFAGVNALQDHRGESNVDQLNQCVILNSAPAWDAKAFNDNCAKFLPSDMAVSGPDQVNSLGGHDVVYTKSLPSPQKLYADNIEAAKHQDAINRAVTSGAAAAGVLFLFISGEIIHERRKQPRNPSQRPSSERAAV